MTMLVACSHSHRPHSSFPSSMSALVISPFRTSSSVWHSFTVVSHNSSQECGSLPLVILLAQQVSSTYLLYSFVFWGAVGMVVTAITKIAVCPHGCGGWCLAPPELHATTRQMRISKTNVRVPHPLSSARGALPKFHISTSSNSTFPI